MTNIYKTDFFTNRIANIWNKLSTYPKYAKNVNEFKNLIDIELNSQRYVYDD